jgi:periplasmic divalent cation tolerance protein
MASDVRVVLVTCPDDDGALALARALVEERLVACVNVVERVRSIYRWNGEVCDDREALMIIKTRDGVVRDVVERVIELHPYDVPEVIALPVVAGAEPYLSWVCESTQRGEAS